MSKDTKELTVVKTTVFDKIKKFFKILFLKNKKNIEDDEILADNTVKSEQSIQMENLNKTSSNDFVNNVKVEEDTEEARLIKLQNLIAEDVIKEEELPDEDIKALNKLYDKQILELKKNIDEYKQKIVKLREKINE